MIQMLDVCVGQFGNANQGIPSKIAMIAGIVYRALQIFVPILLIIWGMLDLGKAVMAQKEDEIKKGQQTFIKRLIAAAIVFFVFTIVSLLFSLVADDTNGNMWDCVDAIINCTDSGCTGGNKK